MNTGINSLTGSISIGTTGTDPSTSTIISFNTWSSPVLVDTIINDDSVDFIYKETSMISTFKYPPGSPNERVFKIIFSCIDGKHNKSERIYGEIIPATSESYDF